MGNIRYSVGHFWGKLGACESPVGTLAYRACTARLAVGVCPHRPIPGSAPLEQRGRQTGIEPILGLGLPAVFTHPTSAVDKHSMAFGRAAVQNFAQFASRKILFPSVPEGPIWACACVGRPLPFLLNYEGGASSII